MNPIVHAALLMALVVTAPAVHAQRVNLAKFQTTVSVSDGGDTNKNEAVDGIVSNTSRWYSDSDGSTPHWLEVQLKAPYTVGSAHLYTGLDDGYTPRHIEVQYRAGSRWVTIPSTVRNDNTATDLVLGFDGPVTATRFRAYSRDDVLRIKEFALFPYNDGLAYPLGTDVILSLGRDREATSSSVNSRNFPMKAIDGWVHNDSRFLAANNNGPHTLTINFGGTHKTGGLHLYTGTGGGENVLADFEVEYHDGSAWQPARLAGTTSGRVSGHRILGNTDEAVAVNFFGGGYEAEQLRVRFSTPYGRVRELVAFPANRLADGSSGYPLGAGVQIGTPPNPGNLFKTFHDAWHRLTNRDNGAALTSSSTAASVATADTPRIETQYQLLYSKANNAFRLRARDSGRCLEVENASTEPGAAVVEGDYSAAPHQLWELRKTGSEYRVINLYSGLALQTDRRRPVTVTQQPVVSGRDAQKWTVGDSEHYFRKGTGGWVGSFGTSWGYDWARNDKDGLGIDKFYAPMQHNGGWPNWGTLHKKYHDWNNDAKPAFLLGFNEPDRPDQADMTAAKAIEHWPKLMAMDIPLVSPATALGGEGWLSNFIGKANDRGYRCEYAGGHWYSGPSSDGLLNHIDYVSSQGGGKPVWLTEFSVVDWSGGSGNWSEETNYAFLMNFLWRAEGKNNLRKYAVFIFSGGVPTYPWQRSNPRSNFRQGNGNLHAFGKLYAAWDGDRTVRFDEPYMLHFYNAMNRLRNDDGTVSQRWVRSENEDIQWVFRDAGNGRMHVISLVDGRRLALSGNGVRMAPPHTTGASVEWTHTGAGSGYGLRFLDHPASGRRLRLRREVSNNVASFTLDHISTSDDWDAARVRPIKPWNKASTAPPAKPATPSVTATPSSYTLRWNRSTAADHHSFNVYRRVHGNVGWVRIATRVTNPTYRDDAVAPGSVYEYAVTDVDLVGFESEFSSSEAIDPNASYPLWAASHNLDGDHADFTADPDGDGLPNGLEFATLSDPNSPNAMPMAITGSGSDVAITFTVNAAADPSIAWQLEFSRDLAFWLPATYTTTGETDLGTVRRRTVTPQDPPAGTPVYYRLAATLTTP